MIVKKNKFKKSVSNLRSLTMTASGGLSRRPSGDRAEGKERMLRSKEG
jgi:hypothetical protein